MYFPYFITYMGLGIGVSVIVFIWALRNGQFSDQQRARFLPLEEADYAKTVKTSRMSRYEIYALAFLACAGLSASAAVLVFALFFSKGGL
jgi:cbb3-type cytochrome oxidase maturation protein